MSRTAVGFVAFALVVYVISGCRSVERRGADLVIRNARVYSFQWDDPSTEGVPAANAPYDPDDGGWEPDATAIAIGDGVIRYATSSRITPG